jgi:hypothetical protein
MCSSLRSRWVSLTSPNIWIQNQLWLTRDFTAQHEERQDPRRALLAPVIGKINETLVPPSADLGRLVLAIQESGPRCSGIPDPEPHRFSLSAPLPFSL